MAFVFQTQRWKQPSPQNIVGPGHYNAQVQSKRPKSALITPPPNKFQQKTISKTSHGIRAIDQNQRIIHQNQKAKLIRKTSPKKHLKRAATAKYTPVRKQSFQSRAIFKPRDMNLEVKNPDNAQKKSFENNMIKKSFRKHHKSIHSELQEFDNKPFCDKSIRTMEKTNQTQTIKSQDIDYFNTMFTRSTSNVNLAKFASSKSKTQNVFISSQPSFLKEKQPENFIIASNNCKKSTVKPSKLVSLKDSAIKKLDAYDDMQTTGIDDVSMDSSFQYISDSTPGPGEYNLRKDKVFYKPKIEQFGVTQIRFKQPKRQQTILNLNAQIPCFKKSSKAPQTKVSFGKSRPHTAKQINSELIYYDDTQNIENKCIKNLIKDRQDPGTFMSKSNRFKKTKQDPYNGPDFFNKEQKVSITLPNSIFMSKFERHQRSLSPTANVDFQGQNYKTIQEKIQRSNQAKHIVDEQAPPFNVSEARFKYKTREPEEEHFKRPLTTKDNKRKELKSYTFRKEGFQNHEDTVLNPAPWTYNVGMKWFKPSHHIRYKF